MLDYFQNKETEQIAGVQPKHWLITKTETNRSAIITKLRSNLITPSEHEFVSSITIESNKETLTTINTHAPQSADFSMLLSEMENTLKIEKGEFLLVHI